MVCLIFYANPITLPFCVISEIYQLELKIRDIKDEEENDEANYKKILMLFIV